MPLLRITVVLLAVTTLSACFSATRTLPAGFYKAAAASNRLPLRVAVVTAGVPVKTYRVQHTLAYSKVNIPAYPQEVAKMLGDIYHSVSVVPTAAEASGADLRISLGGDYPETVTLAFHDGTSGDALAALVEPGVPGANKGKLSTGGVIFFSTIGTLILSGPFITQANANKYANRYNEEIQAVTNTGLQALRARILDNDELILTRADKAALRDLEQQADSALAGGDALGALLGYQQALERVRPGNARALQLQTKAVAAVTRGAAPPVPEEAQNRMTEGRAALALAKSPADYRLASDAMEQALSLAPWWATGHFNTALTQESAGLWSSAAAHLKLFLQLEPQAAEREKLRLKIAELELHQKRGDLPAGMSAER